MEEMVEIEEMGNASETIERLAREAERLRILLIAKQCGSIDELVRILEAKPK